MAVALTINEAREAIYDQFISDWAAQTPIAFDNDKFVPPTTDTAWVRLNIKFVTGSQASLGDVTDCRLFRREGLIAVQVFTPVGDYTYNNDILVADAMNVFEGKHISGIWFRNVRNDTVGSFEEKWYHQNMIAEFQYDEIK